MASRPPATVSPPRRSSDSPGSSTRSAWTSSRRASRPPRRATTGACSEIAAEIRRPVIAALARCHERDIELAGEAIGGGRAGPAARVHLHVRPPHPREAPDHARRSARHGPRAPSAGPAGTPTTSSSRAEDASRTDPDFLCRVVEVAIAGGRHDGQPARHRGLRACRRSTAPMFRDVRARVPGADRRGAQRALPRRPRTRRRQFARRDRGGRRPGRVHRERHRRAGRERRARGDRDGGPGAGRGARLPLQRGHPRDLPDQPAPLLPHRRLPPAQQGDRRAERLRPRGRHPPARHAPERAHLRDHPARDGRDPALDAGAGQALGPPRAGAALPRAGLRADRGQLAEVYRQFTALADRKREILDEDLLALLHESFHDAPEEYQLTHLRVVCGSVDPDRRGADDRPLGGRALARAAPATARSPRRSPRSARSSAARSRS